ncbi:MAG: endo-1,4-beta-xylanase [Lachnospiraceae bacterium]|nr:endo-1,4-beta-xylanase [Lachnospiraceae bacterium]
MTLKNAYKPYFKIGVAISALNLYTPAHMRLLTEQFCSFTCENDMKPVNMLDVIKNRADAAKYNTDPALNFDRARPYLDFAKASGIAMRGHTLVWHNQTPEWFFHEEYNPALPYASRDVMLERLRNYIKGVLEFVQKEYPGVIYAWDVVNEAIDEGDMRKSLWLRNVGRDFVLKAFEYAREYAAPGVSLFYNDYETADEQKRDLIIDKILKPLIERGLIDGMGMQSHLLMDHPDPALFDKALRMYGALGLEIQITELDMHNNDPSDESMRALGERYAKFFKILVDAKKEGAADITSVTFWNLLDEGSWLTGFRKETSYPLLFRGRCEAKKAYYDVVRVALESAGRAEVEHWELIANDEDFEAKMPMHINKEGENTMKEVYDFLKACGVYYLATVEDDQPRVRPFGTIDMFDGGLYIQTGKVKDVSKQLQKNPKAEICAFMDGQWLRVAGKLVRDDRREAKVHMLDAYPNLKGMYSADDDNTEVLRFEDAIATFSSFGGPSRTFKI